MGYRRSTDTGVFTSRWRIKHRGDLADCGIPSDVAANNRRWTYVLLHADDLETGWSASWLTDDQAAKLLALLEPHFPDSTGVSLVETLSRRCQGHSNNVSGKRAAR